MSNIMFLLHKKSELCDLREKALGRLRALYDPQCDWI